MAQLEWYEFRESPNRDFQMAEAVYTRTNERRELRTVSRHAPGPASFPCCTLKNPQIM